MYEYGKRWVEAGHQVTVVTAPYEKSDIRANKFFDTIEVDGIRVRIINASDSNRYATTWRVIKAFQFAFFSSVYALTLRYDVIICSSGPITVGVPGLLAHWLRRKKLIFEVRDLWPAGGIEMGKITRPWQKKLALMFEGICYRQAQLVITASPDQEKHILERYPNLRTLVIPNASDTDLFGPRTRLDRPEWAMGKHLFTHIGSMGFIHNVGFWIEVATELQARGDDSICVVLIGEGVERLHWENVVLQSNLRNVHFLGLLPKHMLPPWVQTSVATLFSTLNNPVQNSSSPNKVFDSFAAGTPIIQTTTGWMANLINREKCGINVAPGDVGAAVAAMQFLVQHPDERQNLAHEASRVAATLFDRSTLAHQYLEALKSLHD